MFHIIQENGDGGRIVRITEDEKIIFAPIESAAKIICVQNKVLLFFEMIIVRYTSRKR